MFKIVNVIDSINKGLLLLLGVMTGVMIGVLCLQVLSRTFIGHSITWSEELSRFIMIYIVFIGASLALRNQQLIAIEFITEKVKFKTRKIMKVIINIIGIIFFGIIFLQGLDVVARVQDQVSAALQISMSYVYMALPIGAVLLTMNALAVIIELLMLDGSSETEEVK